MMQDDRKKSPDAEAETPAEGMAIPAAPEAPAGEATVAEPGPETPASRERGDEIEDAEVVAHRPPEAGDIAQPPAAADAAQTAEPADAAPVTEAAERATQEPDAAALWRDDAARTEEPPTDRVPEPSPEPAPGPAPEPLAAAPAAEPEPVTARGEEDHPSLAGRVLTWLAILIAGGVLFLWAGPRLAPHLPSGLEPVAEWLTPGARNQAAELQKLSDDLSARIAAIRPGLSPEEVEALVAGRVAAALAEAEAARKATETALSERIGTLSDQVTAADSAPIESRLAAMETEAQGLRAELSGLRDQFAGLVSAGGQTTEETAARISQVGEETARRLAALAAEVEGLRAEAQATAARAGALSQRIDEVEAAAARREQEAAEKAAAVVDAARAEQQGAALQAALAEVQARVDAGAPFADLLPGLEGLIGKPVPEGLAAAAEAGVPTLASLETAFPDAAHAAIRAAIRLEAGGDVLSRATSFLEARVATRSLTEREGTDVDAILSRIEARMHEDRLDAALTEAAALPPEAAAPLADWLAAARTRDAARAGLAALRGAGQPTN